MSQPILIAPEGELDFAQMGAFRTELTLASSQEVGIVVDLSAVSFIDSSGLGALVDLHNRLRRADRRLAVVDTAESGPRTRAIYPELGLAVEHRRVDDLEGALIPAWLEEALAQPSTA